LPPYFWGYFYGYPIAVFSSLGGGQKRPLPPIYKAQRKLIQKIAGFLRVLENTQKLLFLDKNLI